MGGFKKMQEPNRSRCEFLPEAALSRNVAWVLPRLMYGSKKNGCPPERYRICVIVAPLGPDVAVSGVLRARRVLWLPVLGNAEQKIKMLMFTRAV